MNGETPVIIISSWRQFKSLWDKAEVEAGCFTSGVKLHHDIGRFAAKIPYCDKGKERYHWNRDYTYKMVLEDRSHEELLALLARLQEAPPPTPEIVKGKKSSVMFTISFDCVPPHYILASAHWERMLAKRAREEARVEEERKQDARSARKGKRCKKGGRA